MTRRSGLGSDRRADGLVFPEGDEELAVLGWPGSMLAYGQLRKLRELRSGQLLEPLGSTPKQERLGGEAVVGSSR